MKLSLVLWLTSTKNSNIKSNYNINFPNSKLVPLTRKNKWLKQRLMRSTRSNWDYKIINKPFLVENRTDYNSFFSLHSNYSLTTNNNKNIVPQNWNLYKSNLLNFISAFYSLNTFLWPIIKKIHIQIFIIQSSMINLKLLKERNFKTLSSANTKVQHFTPTALHFLTLIRFKNL